MDDQPRKVFDVSTTHSPRPQPTSRPLIQPLGPQAPDATLRDPNLPNLPQAPSPQPGLTIPVLDDDEAADAALLAPKSVPPAPPTPNIAFGGSEPLPPTQPLDQIDQTSSSPNLAQANSSELPAAAPTAYIPVAPAPPEPQAPTAAAVSASTPPGQSPTVPRQHHLPTRQTQVPIRRSHVLLWSLLFVVILFIAVYLILDAQLIKNNFNLPIHIVHPAPDQTF